MTGLLTLGVLSIGLALTAGLYALLASPVPLARMDRRRPPTDAPATVLGRAATWLVDGTDRLLHRRGRAPFRAEELELAGLRMSVGSLLVTTLVMGVTASFVGAVLLGGLLPGLVIGLLVPVLVKVILSIRVGRRRREFANQLDATVQLIAASLRSGQSLNAALDAVARETSAPMSEELARIVNEHRLGRDLVAAMETTAIRLESEDFGWVAQAVAIQRDTGGNLNEVLDRVGNTIRERKEIRERIHALSAEGRISAYVLMGLPFVVGAALTAINPGYMAPLFTRGTGQIMLAGCAVMLTVGALWMRSIAQIKI